MKRILAVVAAALIIGAIGWAASSAGAAAGAGAGGAATRSTIAHEGVYSGRDEHHNHIRFTYAHGKIISFRVNHEDAGGTATVRRSGWGMLCDPGSPAICSHGHWFTPNKVKGGWQRGNDPHSTHFEAHAIHVTG
jgi:hypothetical protein